MSRRTYLIWLEWPERCFRVDAEALRVLRGLVPRGSRIVRARCERSFLGELPRATHVVTWHFRKDWFALAPRLELLATPAAGRELLPETGPDGVKIHFGGFHGRIMAESAVGFMMAWAHGFFNPVLEKARWPRKELADACYTLAGTRAVIAGYGKVGKAIGEMLERLGVEVRGFGRGERSRLLSTARSADWFVMALPSTTGTDDFLDASLLARLPRRCVVVNVGRGNSVDEKALCAALRSGRIAGAYLDVRKREPSGRVPDFGGTAEELSRLANCILMPHSSAFAPQYLSLCFRELADEGLI